MPLRKNILLGTAGHVDHGKTALVRLLTGCETDRLAAEKQRGLTIECGFAPCRMGDQRIVGVVDVPGHVDFIRNMVAGAHGIDVVIFVVAADDGVMPQTREHLDILTLMGCRRGVVALTKIDLVDAEMLELVREDLAEFVAGSFLESAPVCGLSNVTGEGFEAFFAALDAAAAACQEHAADGPFRVWVERAFAIRGFGTVASGVPTSGAVRAGDRLAVLPGGRSARVRGLEVYGQAAEEGRAGECVAVNLSDVEAGDLARGQVLCEAGAFEAVRMAEAELRLLPAVPGPLKDYAEVHLHVGAAEGMAHVALLSGKSLSPGESAMVQLRLAGPLGLAAGDRFVIRGGAAGLAGGRVTTLGGGRVLGTSNVRLRRNRPWTLAALAERRGAIDSPPAWCAVHLKEARAALTPAELARRAQVRPPAAEAILAGLVAGGTALACPGGSFVHAAVVEEVAAATTEALKAYHAASPMRVGAERAEVLAGLGADAAAFELAVERLAGRGEVEPRGSLLALAGRRVEVSAEDAELTRRVEAALREAHFAAPQADELAAALGADPARVRAVLRLLVDQGDAVRIDRSLVMHRDAVAAARKVVLDLFARAGRFETVEFRDALGVSRKFAVPLLDYFDTVRLTVRSGSRRTPGAEARNLL